MGKYKRLQDRNWTKGGQGGGGWGGRRGSCDQVIAAGAAGGLAAGSWRR